MNHKVLLITIDGMRPDGLLASKHPFIDKMMQIGTYTLNAQTVHPSVTLPCHMSMFYSVTPKRHRVKSNTYRPMFRPFHGLIEQIKMMGGTTASFYGWEELRDLSRPGFLDYSSFVHINAAEKPDGVLTNQALTYIAQSEPDFVFLHLLEVDELGGHAHGWMSEEYISRIYDAIENVKRIYETIGDRYTIILTADHGGHKRTHGSKKPEDMTIPMFFIGKEFEAGQEICNVSILDIAPTVVKILEIPCAPEWKGTSVI